MSDESQTAAVTDSVPSSIGNAVDADEFKSMLQDDSLEAAGRKLGSQVGREIGGRIGRQLGPTIARDIWDRKNPWTILKNAVGRLVELVVEALQNVDIESSISKLTDVGRSILAEDSLKEGVQTLVPGELTDATDEASEGDEPTEIDAEGDDEPAADDVAAEAADEADATDDAAGEDDGGPDVEVPGNVDLSAEEFRDMKEETYRELLETMSYRDLQSVAKDVGVKANLAQDEMTDRIVTKFSEGSDS